MNIDILFVSYGGSHALMLKNIFKNLLNKNIKVKYLALTAAEQTLKDAGLPYDKIDKFIEDEKYLFNILKIFNLEQKKENFYMALSLDELLNSVGKIEAKRLFKKYGRSIFCQKELASKILDHYKPKILITSNIIRLARGLYLSAKEKSINTIYIEDIFMVPSHKFVNKDFELINLAHPNIEINHIITFSKDAINIIKNNLTKNHIINEPNFIPLGNPNIENIIDRFKNVVDMKNLPEIYDLYLSNMYLRDFSSDILLEYYKTSNRNLIIKTHPTEDEQYYIQKFKSLKNVQIISSKNTLISLIKNSTNIFGTNTTALLEARLVNKPVFCLNYTNSSQIYETFIKTNIAKNITNKDEFNNIFKKDNLEKSHSIDISLNAVSNIEIFLLKLLEV